jgi:predicted PurR-regulated permease PerM
VILIALSVGGVAYGLLGAFLAVPVAAAGLRVAEYVLEQRRADPTVDDTSAPATNTPDAADPSAALS